MYLLQFVTQQSEDSSDWLELTVLGNVRLDEQLYHGTSTIQHLAQDSRSVSCKAYIYSQTEYFSQNTLPTNPKQHGKYFK